MPPVKNVGEPCAGEPHARFDAAAGGNQASRQARAAPAPPADPTATPWGETHGARPLREGGLVPGRGEMHVVLRVPAPRAAPAPADPPKRLDDPSGHHPRPMVGAVAVRPRRGVSALTAADDARSHLP